MSTKKQKIYLIVDNVRSLFNVGSFFRCADVFGVSKVYLCGYTGCPPRKEISKVALGAEENIAWEHKKDAVRLVKKLKREGIMVVALETTSKATSLATFAPTYPLALIVGNEVEGVSRELLTMADKIVEIPMLGKKESLNVSVAAGVALYALRNQ